MTTTTEKKDQKRRDGVRKRGATWQYRLDMGEQPAQHCADCGKRYWIDGPPLKACTCGGKFTRTEERREKTVSGFPTQKLAMAAHRKAKTGLEEGSYVAPRKLTVKQYLEDEWLPSIESALRPSTFASYEQHVEGHLVPELGSTPLQKLTPGAIGTLLRKLQKEGKGRGREGLSPATVRHVWVTLHKALKDAVKRDYIVKNPADAVSPPQATGSDSHEMRTWTEDQGKAFLGHVRADREFPLWRLMLTTGLRRGEACGLRWDDVDLVAATLSVRRQLVNVGYEVKESEPKTKAGKRRISLDDATILTLRAQADQQLADSGEWKEAWTDTGYVFTREDGLPYHPDRVTKLFDQAVAGSRLPRIRLHDLRHSHASHLLKAGVHPKVVQERLGHASIGITMDRYSHLMPGMQEEAAAKIGALLS